MARHTTENGWNGVEHPFAPMVKEVYNTWLKDRKDKFVKKEGEKFFETSDHDLIFTFRQFVKFLTLISSETMEGKVQRLSVFSYITLYLSDNSPGYANDKGVHPFMHFVLEIGE